MVRSVPQLGFRMGIRDTFSVLKAVPDLLTVKKALKPKPTDYKDCFARELEARADTFGDKIAIVSEGREVTWAELNHKSNQIAHALKGATVESGDVVTLFMENRIEFVSCMCAINKLGAIAALINTGLREEPLRHCASSTGSKLFMFGTELAEAVASVRVELDFPDKTGYFAVPDGENATVPDWASNVDELSRHASDTNLIETQKVKNSAPSLYIFTSGTTGLPKAAIVSNNRFLSSGRMSHLAGLKAKPKDRVYICTPLYHGTAAMVGLGAVLSSGASMYLRRRFSVSAFLPEVRNYKCNMFVYVGELCRYLHNSPARKDDADNPLTSIIGNGLRPDIWEDFAKRFGIDRVIEFYGASEGNVAFANLLNKKNTIGMTTTDVRLAKYDVDANALIRDEDRRLVQTEPDETGLCLARITETSRFEGYTDESATEKKVVRDAFEDGDAWFNTGDLLKTVDVGFTLGYAHYQFVDRVGDTFRWRSENVSTTQVSEVINTLPEVEICNVYGVSIPGAEGRAGMAAVTLISGADQLDLSRFAKHVQEQLPAFAWPVFVRVQSGIAMTGTFKLKKINLQREGFDIRAVSDPIYVLKPKAREYAPLDAEFHTELVAGSAGY